MTTSTEFIQWKEYLRQAVDDFDKQDYYLAQIAKEIRATRMKSGAASKLKLKDFLLKFTSSKKKKKEEKSTSSSSRSHWLGLLGIKRSKKGTK